MKKFAISFLCFALCLFVGISATGCKKKKNIKSTNNTENVTSNGGMVVQKGDTLYFVGGMEEASASNKNVKTSAIYSAKVNEKGEFISDPVIFVSSIVGFEFGSIHIFGDYLYYVTPSTAKDSSGETLSGIIEFWRKPLNGGKAQKLYTTSSNDEDAYQYGYYRVSEQDLYILVFEKKAKTIVSVDVGTHPKATTIAKDVTGVTFAENGETNGANKYVFYTHAKDKNLDDQTGNVVERVLPNGDNKTTISEGRKTYSLLSIRGGELLYAENNIIYKTSGEQKLAETDTIVSYLATSSYKDIILFNDHIIAKDSNKNVLYISWKDGEMSSIKICEDTDATFLCEYDGKLYYIADSIIYSVELKEDAKPLKLCEQKAEAPDGNMMPEVVGGYLYFVNKNSDSVLNLYRVSASQTETKDAVQVVK